MEVSTAATATKLAMPFLNILKDVLKETKDEFSEWFQIGLSEYIEDRNKKFSNTNTFISRLEKVLFYDIYFPLNLQSANRRICSDNLLVDIFKK